MAKRSSLYISSPSGGGIMVIGALSHMLHSLVNVYKSTRHNRRSKKMPELREIRNIRQQLAGRFDITEKEVRPIEILMAKMTTDMRTRANRNLIDLYSHCRQTGNTAWTSAMKNIFAFIAAGWKGINFTHNEYNNKQRQDELANQVLEDGTLIGGSVHMDFSQPPVSKKAGEKLGTSITGRSLRFGHYVDVYYETKDGDVQKTVAGAPYQYKQCGGSLLLGNDIIHVDARRHKSEMGLPALLASLGDPNYRDFEEDTAQRIRVQRKRAEEVEKEQKRGLTEEAKELLNRHGIYADNFVEALSMLRHADGIEDHERSGIEYLLAAMEGEDSERSSPMNWLYAEMHKKRSGDKPADKLFTNPHVLTAWLRYQNSLATCTTEDMSMLQAIIMEARPEEDGRIELLKQDAAWVSTLEDHPVLEYWGKDVDVSAPFERYRLLNPEIFHQKNENNPLEEFHEEQDTKQDGSHMTVAEKFAKKRLTSGELFSLYKQAMFKGYRKGRMSFNTHNSNEYLGKHDEFKEANKLLTLLRDTCGGVIHQQMEDAQASTRKVACKAAPIADFEQYEMLRQLVDQGFERQGILLPVNEREGFSRRISAIRNVPLKESLAWYQNAALLLKQVQLHQKVEAQDGVTAETLEASAIMRKDYMLAEDVVFKNDDVENIDAAIERVGQCHVLEAKKIRETMNGKDFNEYKEELGSIAETYNTLGIVERGVAHRRGKTPTKLEKALNTVSSYEDFRHPGTELSTAFTYLHQLARDRNVRFEVEDLGFKMKDLNGHTYVSPGVSAAIKDVYATLRKGDFKDVEPAQLTPYLKQLRKTVTGLKVFSGELLCTIRGESVMSEIYTFERPDVTKKANISYTQPAAYQEEAERLEASQAL